MRRASGARWRVSAYAWNRQTRMFGNSFEAGSLVDTPDDPWRTSVPTPDMEVDEVVIGRWLHLEQMNSRDWWLNVAGVVLNIRVDREGRPRRCWSRWSARTAWSTGERWPEMDAEALCTCGCPYSKHRPQIGRGVAVLACFRHDSCEGFTPERTEEEAVEVEPGPPALLLVDEPLDLAPTSLIYAWNASMCTQCEWRTHADVKACLQCGARLAPVRVEVHSREPG
jgi:hypothetical protein